MFYVSSIWNRNVKFLGQIDVSIYFQTKKTALKNSKYFRRYCVKTNGRHFLTILNTYSIFTIYNVRVSSIFYVRYNWNRNVKFSGLVDISIYFQTKKTALKNSKYLRRYCVKTEPRHTKR
jgi:bisphosphoglycerate-dependent phosphoglycerate mutase